MSSDENQQAAFDSLKDILSQHAKHLVVTSDTEENFYLDTAHVMKNKKPLFFGSVNKGKAYVSYHLMPVYLYPELLEPASPELKKRMQGKSCFNFKAEDDKLFKELARLTKAGFQRYKAEGLLK